MHYVAYKLVYCPSCNTKDQMPDPEGGPLVEDMSLGPQYICEICGNVWREKYEDVAVTQGTI